MAEVSSSVIMNPELMINMTLALYEVGTNLVLSPSSLVTLLAMALAGAGGATQAELLRVLFKTNLSSDQNAQDALDAYSTYLQSFVKENERIITGSNFFYGNRNVPIKPQFVQALEQKFHATAKQLDFADRKAVETINDDVSVATRNLIKRLVSSLSPDDIAILINAIYFKGLWSIPFKTEETKQETFTKSDGSIIQVPMMNAMHEHGYGRVDELNAEAMRLDYDNSTISMLILLPDTSSSVQKLLRKLNEKTLRQLQEVTDEIKMGRKIRLALPKFKLESTHDMVPVLTQLGISEIFGQRANLSGISDAPFQVSQVVHKAVIEVNEEGTEAAAGSSLKIVMLMAPPPPITFKVDRPFVFLLTTADQNIIFSGVVENPIVSS